MADGAGSSHTLDEYWATGFNDDAPTAASNAAAIRTELTTELPRIDFATSVARDYVLDPIDDIEVGSGVGTIIPVSQVPIPTERTWVLKHTGDGLQGELPLVRRVGESQPFAVDWRSDLSANARPVSVDVVEITSRPDGGVTINDEESDTGVDRSQAKFKLTLNSVGTYTLALEVTYADSEGSGTDTAEVIDDGDRAVLVSGRTRASCRPSTPIRARSRSPLVVEISIESIRGARLQLYGTVKKSQFCSIHIGCCSLQCPSVYA